MKKKTSSVSKRVPTEKVKIEKAYDFTIERRLIREMQLTYKEVIAWFQSGRVVFKQWDTRKPMVNQRARVARLFNQWIEECDPWWSLGFERAAESDNDYPRVSCLAVSDGREWSVWKDQAVQSALFHLSGNGSNRSLYFLSGNSFPFGEDIQQGVWLRENDNTERERLIAVADAMIWEVAELCCEACDLLEGFETEFNRPNLNQVDGDLWTPVSLIRIAKQAFDHLIGYLFINQTRQECFLDAAVAFRQGCLVAGNLAQARAYLANLRARQFTSRIGQGRSAGKLRALLGSSKFSGKSPGEIMSLLDGQIDPDFPGQKFRLKGEFLIRGNGRPIKHESFKTIVYRARKAAELKSKKSR